MRQFVAGLRRAGSATVLVIWACACSATGAQTAGTTLHRGLYRGNLVTYQQRGVRKVFQADILLDHVTEAAADEPEAPLKMSAQSDGLVRPTPMSDTLVYPQYLWPQVSGVYQIPYVIVSGSANLTTAINQFNSTFSGFMQFVPYVSQPDYVSITLDSGQSGQCESYVGRVGGMQPMGGSGACTVGTLLHEMGHVVGLFHEQSRADRATYVTVNYANVIQGSRANFDILPDNSQASGFYDYASVMHYIPYAFSANGGVTLESIPAGIGLSNAVGYTAGDIDGIERLYGAVPKTTTITSNPPGLKVTVDGLAITTPQTYAWALNSTHKLAIPSGAQTLSGDSSGDAYTYGRWGHATAAASTITVTAGDGHAETPTNAPAKTVYSANFIKLLPFALSVYPTGAGTATATPAPRTYSGITGAYFVDRQTVTLAATPASGENFYSWWAFLPNGAASGSNPLVVATPYGSVQAGFTTSPVTTVTTNPVGNWMYVDGTFFYGPKNFALPYDTSWTDGSQHTVATVAPQQPYSINTRLNFVNWSDGGAISHTITLPSPVTSATYTASLQPQYVLITETNADCAGSVTATPSSPDGFYNAGTTVKVKETPASGWDFLGWHYAATGTLSSASVKMTGEALAQAIYNTTTKLLAITSLMPNGVPVGEIPFTLQINGTGFTPATQAYIGTFYRASTYVSPTQITVPVQAADLTTPGGFQVAVANFPSGAACSVYVPTTFFVLDSGAQVATTTTVTSSANPVAAGSPVTFTAQVLPKGLAGFSGYVNFKDGATVIASVGVSNRVGGVAAYTTSALGVGSHIITAVYEGNTGFVKSVSNTLTQVVQ